MGTHALLEEILLPGTSTREVVHGIHSLYEPGSSTNAFDEAGALSFYDFIACNPAYNKIMWGYSTADYGRLCRKALDSGRGWVIDAGCGSLAFTADVYSGYRNRPVLFLDQSLCLLRKARERLSSKGGLTESMVFLHGDALDLPFKPGVFSTVIALNLLHMIEDLEWLHKELAKVTSPGCSLLFTTLVLCRRWSDRYLKMWARRVALIPRTREQVLAFFSTFPGALSNSASGNMLFLTNNISKPQS
jgi:SAM-dependent methyltransferase